MNGLPFENLPAAQVEEVRKNLRAQWQIEASALDKSWFSDRGKFNTAKAKLNAKYQRLEFDSLTKLQQQQQEQERVQELIRQPREYTREEEAGLRMELKPEAERLVFPKRVDPRTEYHANLRLRNELMRDVASYQVDSKGRLYRVDEETEKIDKSMPATSEEIQGWMNSITALGSAQQDYRERILPQLTTTDILPTRLQELLLAKRETSWRKRMEEKAWKIMKYIPGYPMAIARGREYFTREAPGTFGDKVSATMGQPIMKPRIREPEQKITRKQLLTEYRRLGGSQTTEGKAFADRYLR